jgi:uncharacterized protein with FMN-binding domain
VTPMRRLTLWTLATAVIVVLLFSYRTSTIGAGSPAAAPTVAPGRPFDGTLVQTRFGPIQIRISLRDGKIDDVTAITAPSGNPRTDQINAAALPKLRERALAARSADIETVSGATYTSAGYRESLQAAIDKTQPQPRRTATPAPTAKPSQ